MSAGQAAGTHCALSESYVGTTTQRGSCDFGVLRYGLGHKVAANLPFGADHELLRSNRLESMPKRIKTSPASNEEGLAFASGLVSDSRRSWYHAGWCNGEDDPKNDVSEQASPCE